MNLVESRRMRVCWAIGSSLQKACRGWSGKGGSVSHSGNLMPVANARGFFSRTSFRRPTELGQHFVETDRVAVHVIYPYDNAGAFADYLMSYAGFASHFEALYRSDQRRISLA